MSVRDFDAVPLTLREARDALDELASQARNYGEKSEIGRLCDDTYAVLEHVIHEYLRSSEQ